MKDKTGFDALPASKDFIRKFILAKRNALAKKQINEKSAKISKKLFSLPEFKRAKTIFTYVSFGSEAGTREIIGKSIALGKIVAVPIADFKKKKLEIVQFTSFSSLKKSKFGIPEPDSKKAKWIPASQIDLVVVPGVAFDLKRNRIGYGKGFYDAFLSKHRKLRNIGLAFDLQVLGKIPAGKKDKKVMKIITEKRIVG